MSNDSHSSIWVKDIDGYVHVDSFVSDKEAEAQQEAIWAAEESRRVALDEIGEISLFNGRAISRDSFDERGFDPDEWRWAIHQAKNALHHPYSDPEFEQALVRELLSLGRSYAIARYANWENIPYSSAQTASLPLGLVALLHQFLNGQGIRNSQLFSKPIRDGLHSAKALSAVTAYRRASVVQSLIHTISEGTKNHRERTVLDREATRIMLSLARLHFSVEEIKINSFAELAKLSAIYQDEREVEEVREKNSLQPNGRFIRNWRLRHLRALTELMPYSIRYGLERGIRHLELNNELPREVAVNELALAHVGVRRMRKRVQGTNT